MGSSVSFLYRVIATVEIVSSGVITIFGVNTFLLFSQRDGIFQKEKEMIYYSSLVAVLQSLLTIIASIILIGCYISSAQSPPPPEQKRHSQMGHPHSLRRKAIAPTWIAWSLISIASLLFVFIAPIHYCIQSDGDREKLELLQIKDGFYETFDNKRLGLCYSESEELAPIRSSLSDLYSFSFIGIMFKTLFVFLVYKNWRRELRRGKKIMIYMQGCDSSTNNDIQDAENVDNVPSKMVASSSTAATSEKENNGDGGNSGSADVKIVIDKPK